MQPNQNLLLSSFHLDSSKNLVKKTLLNTWLKKIVRVVGDTWRSLNVAQFFKIRCLRNQVLQDLLTHHKPTPPNPKKNQEMLFQFLMKHLQYIFSSNPIQPSLSLKDLRSRSSLHLNEWISLPTPLSLWALQVMQYKVHVCGSASDK